MLIAFDVLQQFLTSEVEENINALPAALTELISDRPNALLRLLFSDEQAVGSFLDKISCLYQNKESRELASTVIVAMMELMDLRLSLFSEHSAFKAFLLQGLARKIVSPMVFAFSFESVSNKTLADQIATSISNGEYSPEYMPFILCSEAIRKGIVLDILNAQITHSLGDSSLPLSNILASFCSLMLMNTNHSVSAYIHHKFMIS